MKLDDYLDKTKLDQYIVEGWVNVRSHHTLPLLIYSYSRKTVFANKWDEITTKTRGLIVDKDGIVVARPYEKFFSVEQRPELLVEAEREESAGNQPVITEKVNGCLGTFWKYGMHWGIATKGSFHSPHAGWATRWMERHIEEHGKLVFPEGYTPVFEIICQEVQPHVIKYKHDHLVLLSLIHNETGEELPFKEMAAYGAKNKLGVPWLNMLTIEQALKADSDEFEGYVATYNRPCTAPLKLKIKFQTFLKNRKAFYDEIKRAKIEHEPCKVCELETAKEIVKKALIVCTTRKEFAEFFNKPENKQYASECFKLMDYDKREKNVNTRSREESAIG